MANGSRPVGADGSNSSPLGKLADALENRIVLVALAATLGMGGNLAIVKNDPRVRADPFTGNEGRALTRRIDLLEYKQKDDDKHRIEAVSEYKLIDNNNDEIRLLQQQFQQLQKQVDNIQSSGSR